MVMNKRYNCTFAVQKVDTSDPGSMTSLGVPLTAEAYDTLLDHYLKSKQFSVASDLLISMSPSIAAFNRFIHYCTQSGEMERAEMAFALMSAKSLPVTKPIVNMMIRGHGGRGHLEDAMSMHDEMEEKYGLKPNAETYGALLDASLAMNDLERSMWAFEKLDELGFKVTINRIRKLVRGLCLERRMADAFSVFNAAVASKVPCDAAVCSDLIDLLQQVCPPPHLVRRCIPIKSLAVSGAPRVGHGHLRLHEAARPPRRHCPLPRPRHAGLPASLPKVGGKVLPQQLQDFAARRLRPKCLLPSARTSVQLGIHQPPLFRS